MDVNCINKLPEYQDWEIPGRGRFGIETMAKDVWGYWLKAN